VTLANQRIGGTGSQVLTVANLAPSSAFTETLSASFGANSGNATNNGGACSALPAARATVLRSRSAVNHRRRRCAHRHER